MKIKFAILLMLLCSLLLSIAQLLYKIGADKLQFDFFSIISNWNIMLGLTLGTLGAIILIISLKYHEVSTLYPIIASSYIWVALGSSYFLGETIGLVRWLGIITITVGIIIINFGRKEVSEL